ncbi:MAG: M1 family metallopeptidase [Flavobacteriia bacterium]|nr:M1 family metallopeptidase [Flavobacteriia bacterium]
MKKIIATGLSLCFSFLTLAQEATESSRTQPLYRSSASRTTDVVHMDLKVKFDWDNAYLLGEATLTLKPHFYELDTFVLDAQGMEIQEVKYVSEGRSTSLQYEYDGRQLRIATGRTQTRNDEMKVFIKYISKPNELQVEGGQAISEAKGLYFINPQNHPHGWMRQVWTQGEPQSNSAWFPTVDQPNERMTHEIAITVPRSYATLSNGRLDFRTNNSDGTRTDFWLMDQPHAPYLVMMAVGEFASQSEEWNGIPVNYYVEPEYEDVAQMVYPNTVEMLQFFSDRLGVTYPWQKYDQITVREYVSGAMENTTGVIFGDFMYGDSLTWADGSGEDVVSHEMFHHWFGDLVTCESWANLPLNESFATYGEVLWKEYKYGEEEGEWHAYMDLRAYMSEYNRGKSVDMIRYDYNSVLGMFDRHSYSKGGRILLMLRRVLGDEAFFAGLQHYLENNAYSAVEIHDLRLSMEAVSGLDLNWFFNQWFLDNGHPVLDIEHEFNREEGKYYVRVTQSQDLDEMPLYRMPVRIDVYTSLGTNSHEVWIEDEHEEFVFEVNSKPFLVHFDADQYLLAEINDPKPVDYLLHQLAHGPRMMDRYEAFTTIISDKPSGVRQSTIVRIGMQDDFWAIRATAVNEVEELPEAQKADLKSYVQALLNDEDTEVQARALDVWHKVYGEGDVNFYSDIAQNSNSDKVRATAFDIWASMNNAAAYAHAMDNVKSSRGERYAAMIDVILSDPSRIGAQGVVDLMNAVGPEQQGQIHYNLPYFMSRLNESERESVLNLASEIHEQLGRAEMYFSFGIRMALQKVEMESDGEEYTDAQIQSRKSFLESLRS